MEHITQNKIENLISNCKTELLNHTLQNEVISPHIKNINSYLEDCLAFLQEEKEDTTKNKRKRSTNINGEEKENILFFAYCMSKWDYQFTNSLTEKTFNQSEAFQYLAKELKTKVATLRNYRDEFDSHVTQNRSNRKGWKKPLKNEFSEVIKQYDTYSEAELINAGKNILWH